MLRLPFIGRNTEVQQLHQLMSEARAGRGSLLLLGGESGAGKTALLEAATGLESGLLVLTGHCPGPDETQLLGPFKEIVALLTRAGHDPAALPQPFGTAPMPAWSAAEMALLLTSWLAERGLPLVVLLEDIHWADASSLELLRYVAPRLGSTPVLVVATYRSDEVHRLHPLWSLLPQLQRVGAGRLQLERLTEESVRALVAYALPDLAAPAAAAAHLFQRTGGNALFVRELLAESSRTHRPPAAIAGLPETLQQAIDTRLDRLSPATLAVCQAAALIGERCSFDLLARTVGLPDEALEAAIAEALNLRIIRSNEGDSFVFDHALVREALFSRLIPVQRRRWHRQIADALLASGSLDLEALALHLGRARDPRAVRHLMALGDRALRRGMLLPAQAAYEQALDLLAEGECGRAELLMKIGQTIRYADRERANRHWDEAVREALLTGEKAAGVWARNQALSFQTGSRPLVTEAQVRALIEEAEAILQDPDYLRLETDLYGCTCGYPRALTSLAEFMLATGRFGEGAGLVDQIQTRTAPGSNPYPIIFIKAQLAWVRGEYEAYLDLVRRMAAAQYETRYYRNVVEWEATALGTLLLCRADSPDQVDAQARRVLAVQAEARERSGYTINDGFEPIGFYQFMRGDWEGARRNLLEPLQVRRTGGHFVRSGAAVLQLALGDPAGALETLAPLFPVSPETEPGYTPGHHAIGTQCQRAQILLQQGELAQARAWLEAADRWMARREIVPFRPVLHLTWAEEHLRTGDRDQAAAEARKALQWALSLPDLPAQIEARRLLGRLSAQAGQTEEAAEHLRTALALAERCRFPHEAELTRTVLAEVLPKEQPDAAGPEPLPDSLSQREAEIIRLVARGLTDKQVGAALFISPRTVDGHLRRIFVKIGISSRTALGAYAARHGLDR